MDKDEEDNHHQQQQQQQQSVLTLLTELIVEILLRLPVDSLLRCKSVCKSWRSLISNPRFISKHLKLSTTNNHYSHHHLIFSTRDVTVLKTCNLYNTLYDDSLNALKLDCPFKRPRKSVSIIGSCNGLLCIRTEENELFIWNPITRISNRIPYDKMRGALSVFYGFGYDELTDDYKVVEIGVKFIERYKYKTFVKMFSLRNGNWKNIGEFPDGMPLNHSATYLNGALHWDNNKDIGGDFSDSCSDGVVRLTLDWTIVALDLATETYREVVQPDYDAGYGYGDLSLGCLRQWLSVLCNYRGSRVDLWVMKVYGVKDSWTKLVSIPFLADPEKVRYSVPLCVSNDGKVLLQLGSKLLVYDSKDGSFSENQNFDKCIQPSTFVESLVSPMSAARLGR